MIFFHPAKSSHIYIYLYIFIYFEQQTMLVICIQRGLAEPRELRKLYNQYIISISVVDGEPKGPIINMRSGNYVSYNKPNNQVDGYWGVFVYFCIVCMISILAICIVWVIRLIEVGICMDVLQHSTTIHIYIYSFLVFSWFLRLFYGFLCVFYSLSHGFL